MLTALIAAAAFAAQPAPVQECGTTTLYGKTLTVRVTGPDLTCEQARTIVDRRRCRARKHWSCTSFRPPGAVLVWFKEQERFAQEWSTYIEAVRPPCEQSAVTRRAWGEARKWWRDPFPTRRQVLADDLMRCDQLDGMSKRQVRALLGGRQPVGTKRFLEWELGADRGSFVRIDSEYLSVRFDRDGVDKVAMYQG